MWISFVLVFLSTNELLTYQQDEEKEEGNRTVAH